MTDALNEISGGSEDLDSCRRYIPTFQVSTAELEDSVMSVVSAATDGAVTCAKRCSLASDASAEAMVVRAHISAFPSPLRRRSNSPRTSAASAATCPALPVSDLLGPPPARPTRKRTSRGL